MKWKEMSTPFKILHAISLLCLVAAMYFLLFDQAGIFAATAILENGTRFAGLLTAFSGILQGVINWKSQRVSSIILISLWAIVFVLNLLEILSF